VKTLDLLLVVAMVPFATVNPFLYALIFNWRRSAEGRALMTCFVGLALLVDFAVLYALLPWFPAKPYVAAVVYALILTGFIRFTLVLVRELRSQHRRR
jgi:hypothetical protein